MINDKKLQKEVAKLEKYFTKYMNMEIDLIVNYFMDKKRALEIREFVMMKLNR